MDPQKIKDQTAIKSGNVSPEEAAKDVEEIKDEALEGISGGLSKPNIGASYGDFAGL